jgi:hypothetical protein
LVIFFYPKIIDFVKRTLFVTQKNNTIGGFLYKPIEKKFIYFSGIADNGICGDNIVKTRMIDCSTRRVKSFILGITEDSDKRDKSNKITAMVGTRERIDYE